jgi:hypothetical protein
MKRRYLVGREIGLSRRAALYGALPTRLHAVVALARGGTVIYRATITAPVRVNRPHSFIAESTFVGEWTDSGTPR